VGGLDSNRAGWPTLATLWVAVLEEG